MIFRTALSTDIPQIMTIRLAVNENKLSKPSVVTAALCADYLFNRGKGWVCEIEGRVVGFSIIDLKKNNVWALFVHPDFERQGIGRKLHNLMLNWYFEQGKRHIWLGTSPGTRAEDFYQKAGWRITGKHGEEELKLEMTIGEWNK